MKLYSLRFIASVLDLSERRVRQLRDQKILIEARKNYFDLIPAIQAYIAYLRSLSTDGNQASDYNLEKAKFVRARRENQELDLEVKRGELYPGEEVELVVSDMLIRFKSHLLSIPSKLSPQLSEMSDKNTIQRLLKREVAEALSELSAFKKGMEEKNTLEITEKDS